MSLEIRSIGEVISYQATPRTEFVVGMKSITSETSEIESIMFNIVQFIPVDVEDPCYVTSMAPKDVVYFYGTGRDGTVTKVDSPAPTLEKYIVHSHDLRT